MKNRKDLEEKLTEIKQGDEVVYYIGKSIAENAYTDPSIAYIRSLAWRLHLDCKATLVQRMLGSGLYEYIAVGMKPSLKKMIPLPYSSSRCILEVYNSPHEVL